MPNRMATWAIAIWTALMALAIVAAALGIGADCVGLPGSELSACRTDAWGRGTIGLALLGLLWFLGFVPLWFVWRRSRPEQSAER